MVDRPYHDYSTNALRELSRDLALSQIQLEDQRADYVKPGGSDNDDLRQFDALINKLGDQLAAVDQELVTRDRETTAAAAGGHRGQTRHPSHVPTHSPQVMGGNPKPHCRAKRFPARARTPH